MANMSLFSGVANKVSDGLNQSNMKSLADNLAMALKSQTFSDQNSYSTQKGAATAGLELANAAADRRARASIADKELEAEREIRTKRALGATSYSTDLTKRDIFGRNQGDVQDRQDDDRYTQERDARKFNYDSQAAQRDAANTRELTSLGIRGELDKARLENQGRLGAASIQAQGSVLGSLFGSVGSGSPNFRYWSVRGE